MCCNYNKNKRGNKDPIKGYFYSEQKVLTTCSYFLLLPAQSRKYDSAHNEVSSGSVLFPTTEPQMSQDITEEDMLAYLKLRSNFWIPLPSQIITIFNTKWSHLLLGVTTAVHYTTSLLQSEFVSSFWAVESWRHYHSLCCKSEVRCKACITAIRNNIFIIKYVITFYFTLGEFIMCVHILSAITSKFHPVK